MDRREIITGALASVGAAVAVLRKKKIERIETEGGSYRFFEDGEEIRAAVHDENFIERWIIPHGGDCCGCIRLAETSEQCDRFEVQRMRRASRRNGFGDCNGVTFFSTH